MSYLQSLIGRTLLSLDRDLSRSINLQSGEEIHELPLQLQFNQYLIRIYNRYDLINLNRETALVGSVLTEIIENEQEIIFRFGSSAIRIDLSHQSHIGPEALSLQGPNDLFVVWP